MASFGIGQCALVYNSVMQWSRAATGSPPARSCHESINGEALLESWLWRCTHGVKPAADVYLGMGFAAVMPGTGRCGSLGTPSVHSKLGIPTSNHEPVHGIIGHDSTDLTSEFLQSCHRLFPEACLAFISQLRRELNLVSTPSTRRPVPSSPCHEAGKHAPSSIVRE